MKYGRNSNVVSGMKEFYTIVSFNVDQVFHRVSVMLAHITPNTDGTVEYKLSEQIYIADRLDYIIDPSWDENSNPPKPEGFDPIDPSTWGDLSFDQIPKVPDESKLYVTKIITAFKEGKNFDEHIINALIAQGRLPNSPEWRKL